MIKFNCPECDRTLRAPDDEAGGKIRCPDCGRKATVPEVDDLDDVPEAEDKGGEYRSGKPPIRRVDEDEKPVSRRRDDDDERPRRRRDDDEDNERRRPVRQSGSADEVLKPRRRKKKKKRRRNYTGILLSVVDNIPLDYSVQVVFGLALGIILNVVGGVMVRTGDESTAVIGDLVGLAGLPFWLWACAAYAKSKGYSELLGLLGLIGCCGLLVIRILPEQG